MDRITCLIWSVLFGLLTIPEGLAKQLGTAHIEVKDSNTASVVGGVVYLLPQFRLPELKPLPKTLIVQKEKAFSPLISVAYAGSELTFYNQDDITHHIYSLDPVHRFEFQIRSEQSKQIQTANKAGEVTMGCNIHDWMSGHLLLVNSPFFTLTDQYGVATFGSLPMGNYTVKVWYPTLKKNKDNTSHQISVSEQNLNPSYNIQLDSPFKKVEPITQQNDFDFLSEYE